MIFQFIIKVLQCNYESSKGFEHYACFFFFYFGNFASSFDI